MSFLAGLFHQTFAFWTFSCELKWSNQDFTHVSAPLWRSLWALQQSWSETPDHRTGTRFKTDTSYFLCYFGELHWVNIHRDDLMVHAVRVKDHKSPEYWHSELAHGDAMSPQGQRVKNIIVDLSKTNTRVHQKTKMWLRSQSLDSICECMYCCTRLNQ